MTKDEFAYQIGLALGTTGKCINVNNCLARECTHATQAKAVNEMVWPFVEAMVEAAKPKPTPPGTIIEEIMPNGLRAWTIK